MMVKTNSISMETFPPPFCMPANISVLKECHIFPPLSHCFLVPVKAVDTIILPTCLFFFFPLLTTEDHDILSQHIIRSQPSPLRIPEKQMVDAFSSLVSKSSYSHNNSSPDSLPNEGSGRAPIRFSKHQHFCLYSWNFTGHLKCIMYFKWFFPPLLPTCIFASLKITVQNVD